jgi:tryptophanyl-tRNA synthetase
MRVFSGIQPTGILHLGNYFGVIANWVKLQNAGNECFYSIVDQHAITQPQDPETLRANTLQMAATIIACGIDPEKSTLFVQSDVPEHAQLAWILTCLAPMGQMERMIQFKEKSEKKPSAVNVGLFSYPILQAADILLYKTDLVPVGIDQAQHLELTRDLAEKFNRTYKPLFSAPKTLHTNTTKVIGLDGKNKMSKGLDNYIGIIEEKERNWNKLRVAATDPARVMKKDPGTPEICNVYSLHNLFSPKTDIEWAQQGCKTAGIGCIECKKKLFENMEQTLLPIRKRYQELMAKPEELRALLHSGASKARAVAKETLAEIYDAIGFRY